MIVTGASVQRAAKHSFRDALAGVWAEQSARRFTIFVFVSMLAFSAQDLILEPFAGLVFAMTPGESTSLSGVQHSGVFAGMALIGVAGNVIAKRYPSIMRVFTVGGCLASALALIALAIGGLAAPAWPLEANVFALGFANGVFAVAAIGSMMGLASEGQERREGTRMGLWGAAQAVAFGLGSFLGTVGVDAARSVTASNAMAYGAVFLIEGLLFIVSAWLAARLTVSALDRLRRDEPRPAREIVSSVIGRGNAQLAGAGVAAGARFAGEGQGALR
jgi:BCD family chlorophyll transporter-like MFS transporter